MIGKIPRTLKGLGDFTGEKEVIILRSERGVFVKFGVLKTTDWDCILTLRELLFAPERGELGWDLIEWDFRDGEILWRSLPAVARAVSPSQKSTDFY